MSLDSLVVCQIPDCTTTQAEIELELKTFLSSYCTVCKQDRNGKLCGCAFPCSLSFRAHMLNKIHDLLGIEKPPSRKTIQVCFKHPDLLKQAREACVAKRRELCTAARARRFDRSSTSSAALGSSIATSVAYDTQDEQERSKIPFTSLMNLEEEYTLEAPSTSQQAVADVRSSEVSLENDPELENSEETDSEFEEFEDFARRKFAEIDRTQIHDDDEKTEAVKMTKILFSLGNKKADKFSSDEDFSENEDDSDQIRTSTIRREPEPKNICLVELESENNITDSLDNINDVNEDELREIVVEKPNEQESNIERLDSKKRPKLFYVKYQNYHNCILMSELYPLLHKSFLNDVQIVCRDGQVLSSSLLLGSMSHYLRDILSDIPPVDKMKVVIMPDVSTSELETFLGFLFVKQEKLLEINERDARRVQTLASIFQIGSISIATKRPGRPKGSANKTKTPTGQKTNSVGRFPDNFIDLTEPDLDPTRLEVTNRCKKRRRSGNNGFKGGSNRSLTKANIVCTDEDVVAMEEDDDHFDEPFVTNLAKDSGQPNRASDSRNEAVESSNEVIDLNIQVSSEMLNHA